MSGLSSVCRRRGHDDPCVDGGSAMYGIRIVCRALQESTRPNRHPRYGKPAPENGTYLLQCGVRRTWAVEFAARGEFTAPTSRDPLAKSPSAPSVRVPRSHRVAQAPPTARSPRPHGLYFLNPMRRPLPLGPCAAQPVVRGFVPEQRTIEGFCKVSRPSPPRQAAAQAGNSASAAIAELSA